jgi:hypothetical protein
MLAPRDENSDTTCATCPRQFWMEYVQLAAQKLGARGEDFQTDWGKDRLARAYFSGEPVWIAAEMFALISRERGKKSCDTLDEIRRGLRASFRAR